MSEFIKWSGGFSPSTCNSLTNVEVQRASGSTAKGKCGEFDWGHDRPDVITAYRILGSDKAISNVVAKMLCNVTETIDNGYSKQTKVKFGAVCGNKDDDKSFTDATPSGEIWMNISDGRPAAAFFKPGKSYYVTFTEAE